jgi:hypothetical protein
LRRSRSDAEQVVVNIVPLLLWGQVEDLEEPGVGATLRRQPGNMEVSLNREASTCNNLGEIWVQNSEKPLLL